MPHGGCAPYPNQRLFSFLSRAHTFPSYSAKLWCLRYHLHTSFPVNISTSVEGKTRLWFRGRKSLGHYLMRSRSVRLVFTVILAGLHLIILIFNLDEVFHLVWKWDAPGRQFTRNSPAFKVTLLFSLQQIIYGTFLPF